MSEAKVLTFGPVNKEEKEITDEKHIYDLEVIREINRKRTAKEIANRNKDNTSLIASLKLRNRKGGSGGSGPNGGDNGSPSNRG